MRKIFVMVGLFLNSFVFAQVAEDFTDGEVLHHPQWTGDTGRFIVNTANQLQSRTFNKSDTIFLATQNSKVLNAVWEFYVQINVDPSTSNQMRVYLAFDKANLDSSGNGYFLQIGETGSQDSYDLYKKTGKSIQKIIDGPPKTRAKLDTVKAWFMIIHRVDGYWELFSRASPNLTWDSEGNIYERSFLQTAYTGLSIKHTSTRSDRFLFDDFYIYEYELDSFPPEYNDIEIREDSIITLLFSEELDTNGLSNINNYLLNNLYTPTKVYIDAVNKSLIHLEFQHKIQGGRLTIRIQELSDLLGNEIKQPIIISYNYIAPHYFKRNDIFISEFMADPSPSIGLPENEFIELYNKTSADINLQDWIYTNGNSNIKLPFVIVKANDYLILCRTADTSLFVNYGEVLGLNTWPSINNTAGSLKLKDYRGTLIDEVNYNSTWYKDKNKYNGGYSLECTDISKTCEGFYVWEASKNNNGGTPGTVNSFWNNNVTVDESFYVNQIEYLNDTSIYLRFNKTPDSSIAKNIINYQLNNPTIHPKRIEFVNDYLNEVQIIFSSKFLNNKNYVLQLNNFKTCTNESLAEPLFYFLYKSNDDTSLVRINEIYVDPSPSYGLPEVEYIELFNTTKNYVNISAYTLSIGTSKIYLPNYTLKPTEYIILCSANDTLQMQVYGKCIGLPSFPSLSNSSATIQLQNKAGRLIDRVSYKNTWYRDETKLDGGWSLELIDPYTKCDFINRWSSSINKTGGTPGSKNSIAEFHADKKDLSVSSFMSSNNSEFQIKFNKPIDGRFINYAQFYFVGAKMKLYFPTSIVLDSPYYQKVRMIFNQTIPIGKYHLVCQYMPTCSRNDTNILFPLTIEAMEEPIEDLVVSEFMADPSPSVNLPEVEYIEIYNRGEKEINLAQFYLADNKDTIPITIENWKAKEYILFCQKNYRNVWDSSIRVHPLNKMLSLGNDADSISILDLNKKVIDYIYYKNSMLPKEKQDGGYSFSKINNTWFCKTDYAWQASNNSKGGSPGLANEELSSYALPPIRLENYTWVSEKTIHLYFDKKLEPNASVSITDGVNNSKCKILENGAIEFTLAKQLSEGQKTELIIKITNCLGMSLDTLLVVHQKYTPKENEVLISEILFNPYPGSVDFIELYNASDKIIDIRDLFISDLKNKYNIGEIIRNNAEDFYISPSTYRVLSPNNDDLLSRYSVPKPNHLIELQKMISLPDNEGFLSIINSEGKVIDQFTYSEKMHLSWLSELEGRSLERKRFNIKTEDYNNWASATDNIGYASPTGKNSQHSENVSFTSEKFWLSEQVVNPESNYKNKQLELNYKIEGDALYMNVKVFNKSGVFISEIIHGATCRNEGILTWDLGVDGSLIPNGTYVLVIECYTEKGKNEYYKIPFAIHY